jgi:exodeoxyribonuclease V alpha subunit
MLNRQGLLSDLALHFGRFIARLDDNARPDVLLGACLVSQWASRGDVCLDLTRVAGQPFFDMPDAAVLPPLDAWRSALLESPVVGRAGDYRPLVLDDAGRLYLYRYWNYERAVAADLLSRARTAPEGFDPDVLREGLARLFPPLSGEMDWQKEAAAAAVSRRFCVISGGPGTGKTTTVIKILCLLIEQSKGGKPPRIALAAPTGKASARLQEAIRAGKEGIDADPAIRANLPEETSTLHRLLGARPDSTQFRYHRDNPLPVDALIVDEASMIDLALLAKLLRALPPKARLILLGDKDQLASVEAGAVLGDICGGDTKPSGDASPLQGGIVLLQKSHRFGDQSGIGQLARAVRLGQAKEAVGLLGKGACDLHWQTPGPLAAIARNIEAGFRDYLLHIREGADAGAIFAAFNRFRVLCAHRAGPAGVESLNDRIIEVLERAGLLHPRQRWYAGRPVMITRNHPALGLFNGDIGIARPDPASENELKVFFESPDGGVRKFSAARLPDHETAFAMTVHKSQGSEFERVLFLMPETVSPVLTRELIYTAITRARREMTIVCSETVFAEAVRRRVERASGLRDALWTSLF